MSDSRDVLADAFAELEVAVGRGARLKGLDAAYATVDGRRRRRAALVASALVLVVLAPLAAFAWWRGSNPAPYIGPSPDVTVSPSRPAPPTPEGPRSVVRADLNPDDRLANARLEVPSFGVAGCAGGSFQFRDGVDANANSRAVGAGIVRMMVAATGDVDHDGVNDVVVNIECMVDPHRSDGGGTQVLAYSGTTLTLLGRVVRGTPETTTQFLSVASSGDVVVEVVVLGGLADASVQFVTYRWSGAAFQSIGSAPRPKYPDPTDLALTVEPQVLRLGASGATTLTVTIHNRGTEPQRPATLWLVPTGPVTIAVDGRVDEARGRRILVIDLPPQGQSATVSLTVRLRPGATLDPNATLAISLTGHSLGYTGNGANVTTANGVTVGLLPA